jgi:phospholipase C
VPLVIVSPYAKQAYVSHVQHDFGSILKFIEGVFNLGLINGAEYADSRADDLSDCFNFTKKARAFKKIPAPYDATFFIHKPQNTDDIDDD